MEKDWEKIYVTKQIHLAEIAKGLLDENGINAVIVNKKDSTYGFGEIELYVHRKDVLTAVNLIKKQDL